MATTGDSFIVTIKRAHLEWGEYRHTDTRGIVYHEGYIQIPAPEAYSLNIQNSNGTNRQDILGVNLFNCESADGSFRGILRAQGNQADPDYAKQFAGNGNLKAVGDWYYRMGATVGDKVRVTWTSPTDILIELI